MYQAHTSIYYETYFCKDVEWNGTIINNDFPICNFFVRLQSGEHFTKDLKTSQVQISYVLIGNYSNLSDWITIKCCICHDSIAVMACAKFHCDQVAGISNAVILEFSQNPSHNVLTLSKTMPWYHLINCLSTPQECWCWRYSISLSTASGPVLGDLWYPYIG